MVFADSHTHLYAEEFGNDLDAMMQRAHEQNVAHLFLPAIDSSYHEKMISVGTVSNPLAMICKSSVTAIPHRFFP